MNRQLAGIATGIFLATSIMTIYSLFTDHTVDNKNSLSSEEAQKILVEDGYHILSKDEWVNYQTDLQALNKLKTEKQQTNKEETGSASVSLLIKPGMSSDEIISLLKEKDVIKDTKNFSTYLDERDLTKKIQTGTYTVYKNMDYAASAAVLTKGK